MGELNDRGVFVVEGVADAVGEVEDGRRPAGIERGPGDAFQAPAPGPFPADPTEPRIGQRRPVEEVPDHAGIVEVGEDLGEDRRPAAAKLSEGRRNSPHRQLPGPVSLEERLADRFGEQAIERRFVIAAASRGDPPCVAGLAQPGGQRRIGAGKVLDEPAGGDEAQWHRGVEFGGQPGAEGRVGKENEIGQPDVDGVVTGPGRLEVPVTFGKRLGRRRRIPRLPGSGAGDEALLEAGRRLIARPAGERRRGAEPGGRSHPPREQF